MTQEKPKRLTLSRRRFKRFAAKMERAGMALVVKVAKEGKK